MLPARDGGARARIDRIGRGIVNRKGPPKQGDRVKKFVTKG